MILLSSFHSKTGAINMLVVRPYSVILSCYSDIISFFLHLGTKELSINISARQ